MLKKIIVALCIVLMSGITFVNIYVHIVDATSWSSNLPQSVYVEREYFKTVNPGTFFRLFAPVLQVLFVVLTIACWKMGARVRTLCILALLIGIGIDVFTFSYFYPRNNIMLHETNPELIIKAVHEWISMDLLRTAIGIANIILCFIIQSKIYAQSNTVNQ